MTAYTLPIRNAWYRDRENVITRAKLSDEVFELVIKWARRLGGYEISGSNVTWIVTGPTITSTTNTATSTRCMVSGLGEVEVQVVTTGGETLIERRRFVAPPFNQHVDYR